MTRLVACLLRRSAVRPLRDEEGAATVEFCLIFPIFIILFISSIEASIFMMRQVMLERSVEVATRPIRLDGSIPRSWTQVRNDICEQVTMLMPDCGEALIVEMISIDLETYDLPDTSQPCINREQSTRPADADIRSEGGADALILLRACYAARPLMPLIGMGAALVADRDGESIRMVTATAFRTEPE
jgi:Flp pilus assembly pilin Flp